VRPGKNPTSFARAPSGAGAADGTGVRRSRPFPVRLGRAGVIVGALMMSACASGADTAPALDRGSTSTATTAGTGGASSAAATTTGPTTASPTAGATTTAGPTAPDTTTAGTTTGGPTAPATTTTRAPATTPAPVTTSERPPTTTVPLPPPSSTIPPVLPDTNAYGYLVALQPGPIALIDVVERYTGAAARSEAARDGVTLPAGQDWYVRNIDAEPSPFRVLPGARVVVTECAGTSCLEQAVGLDRLPVGGLRLSRFIPSGGDGLRELAVPADG
jgi:hypothetical protein